MSLGTGALTEGAVHPYMQVSARAAAPKFPVVAPYGCGVSMPMLYSVDVGKWVMLPGARDAAAPIQHQHWLTQRVSAGEVDATCGGLSHTTTEAAPPTPTHSTFPERRLRHPAAARAETGLERLGHQIAHLTRDPSLPHCIVRSTVTPCAPSKGLPGPGQRGCPPSANSTPHPISSHSSSGAVEDLSNQYQADGRVQRKRAPRPARRHSA